MNREQRIHDYALVAAQIRMSHDLKDYDQKDIDHIEDILIEYYSEAHKYFDKIIPQERSK